jgi:hypothetical protein
MSNFSEILTRGENPTPFGFFDLDLEFQDEANKMILFVKRKLGDDVLSVELTRKEIWACFEEACCEYSRKIHEMKIQSELANVLGMPTSSDLTNRYPHQTLEFLMRQAAPYATYAGVGGVYNPTRGYINIELGRQDYDIYTELMTDVSGSEVPVLDTFDVRGPMKILEVFHFEPLAAQHFLLNASNITNFLATNFNYESYINSTVFYVLPVFEDLLRRGMLETAFRVRRSNYSYQIMGSKLRIYPIPSGYPTVGKLWIKVQGPLDPTNPDAIPGGDETLNGVSGPADIPLDNIPFATITQPGRQWIRQYTLALSKELLGLIRSKFQSIPIPNADLQLNGESLISSAREDKEKLTTQLKEFLDTLTNSKLMEQQALLAENMQKQLKYVAMPRAIVVG